MSSILDSISNLDERSVTLLVAGLCVISAFHVSTMLINDHFVHWSKPKEQTAIAFIVGMVPLFGINAYIGLVEMPEWEVYITILDAVKESYEAFVIYNFLKLMFCYVGISNKPDEPVPESIKGRILHHSFPVTLFLPHEVKLDKNTISTLRWFTIQFMIIRPLFSTILCILEIFGAAVAPWTWIITIVFNVSVYLAIYALLMFFHGFEKELGPHSPLAKFLCIKGVVFFAFWQGLVVKLLAHVGIINERHFPYSVKQVEESIQYFIICLEMLAFSFAFKSAFSALEYSPAAKIKQAEERKTEAINAHYGLSKDGKKEEAEDPPVETKKDQ